MSHCLIRWPLQSRLPSNTSPTGATFIQMLKRRVTESHRFGVPISVLYLKIDEYDIVNRKYGSPIARQMVDTAMPALEKALREMDVMAKLENGEFVVMLPGSTQSEASRVAKRMCAATANCVLPVVDRELQIRLQHGIAELKPSETAQELIARARLSLRPHRARVPPTRKILRSSPLVCAAPGPNGEMDIPCRYGGEEFAVDFACHRRGPTPAKLPSESERRSKRRPPLAKAKRSKSPAAWASRVSWPMTTSLA